MWKNTFDSCESDERITIDCPKDEEVGSIVNWGIGGGIPPDVSKRSTTVVPLLTVDAGSWEIKFSTRNFLRVAAAFDCEAVVI